MKNCQWFIFASEFPLGLSFLPYSFLLYHNLEGTVRVVMDFTFIPSFKCINTYLFSDET